MNPGGPGTESLRTEAPKAIVVMVLEFLNNKLPGPLGEYELFRISQSKEQATRIGLQGRTRHRVVTSPGLAILMQRV